MRRILARAGYILLTFTAPLAAQQSAVAGRPASTPPSFPDTPVGHFGHELIALVNGADSSAIHAFFTRNGAPQMERGRTPVWFVPRVKPLARTALSSPSVREAIVCSVNVCDIAPDDTAARNRGRDSRDAPVSAIDYRGFLPLACAHCRAPVAQVN